MKLPWRSGAPTGRPVPSTALARRVEVGELVGRLTEDGSGRAERGRLLGRLAAVLGGAARAAGARAALTGRFLVDVVADAAPLIPVRDLAALRASHHGASGEDLAEALVAEAARTTGAVGAAGGALAAVQHGAPPALLLTPLQLAAETVAVVLVELRLVAELHVAYGRAVPGPPAAQGAAYLQAWVARRGLDLGGGPPGLSALVASAARAQLRTRLVRRSVRNLSTLAPFLLGAAAGAELNRRETRSLGEALRADLRAA